MKCKYCSNEVTEDSRLAHLGCCAECAAADEVGNNEQVKLGKEALKCQTILCGSSALAC